jgi:hypothetical protein
MHVLQAFAVVVIMFALMDTSPTDAAGVSHVSTTSILPFIIMIYFRSS